MNNRLEDFLKSIIACCIHADSSGYVIHVSEVDGDMELFLHILNNMLLKNDNVTFSPLTETGKCGATIYIGSGPVTEIKISDFVLSEKNRYSNLIKSIGGEGISVDDMMGKINDPKSLPKALRSKINKLNEIISEIKNLEKFLSDMAVRGFSLNGIAHVGFHFPATKAPKSESKKHMKDFLKFASIFQRYVQYLETTHTSVAIGGDSNGVAPLLADFFGFKAILPTRPTGFGAPSWLSNQNGIDGVIVSPSIDVTSKGPLREEDAELMALIEKLIFEAGGYQDKAQLSMTLEKFLGNKQSDHAVVSFDLDVTVIVASFLGSGKRYEDTAVHWKQPDSDETKTTPVFCKSPKEQAFLSKQNQSAEFWYFCAELLKRKPIPSSPDIMVPENTLRATIESMVEFPGIQKIVNVGGGASALRAAQEAQRIGVSHEEILAFISTINDVDIKIVLDLKSEKILKLAYDLDERFKKKFGHNFIPFFKGWFVRQINGNIFLHWKGGSDGFEGIDIVFTSSHKDPFQMEAAYSCETMDVKDNTVPFLQQLNYVKSTTLTSEGKKMFFDRLEDLVFYTPKTSDGYMVFPREVMLSGMKERLGDVFDDFLPWFKTMHYGKLRMLCGIIGDASRVYRFHKMVKKHSMLKNLLGEDSKLLHIFPNFGEVQQLLTDLIVKVIECYMSCSPFLYNDPSAKGTVTALHNRLIGFAEKSFDGLQKTLEMKTSCECDDTCVCLHLETPDYKCSCTIGGCPRCQRTSPKLLTALSSMTEFLEQTISGVYESRILTSQTGGWEKNKQCDTKKAKILGALLFRVAAGLNKSTSKSFYTVGQPENCFVRKAIVETLDKNAAWGRVTNKDDVLCELVKACYSTSVVFSVSPKELPPTIKEKIKSLGQIASRFEVGHAANAFRLFLE
jgi:hypothetical protein